MEKLWLANPLLETRQSIRTTILTCVLYNVWKCHNAKVFTSKDESNSQIASGCHDDLLLWSH